MQESFVFIGTPQPQDISTIKAFDKNQFLPIHLQQPRDERGRKRLHGAFTGGFSAGYFNTVGSKEGWTPSSFVSSKSDRSSKRIAQAKPEDYMDEEDIKEFRAHTISATLDYDLSRSNSRQEAQKDLLTSVLMNEKSAIVGDLASKIVSDWIVPVSDPIGNRLLRAMGWREGQGVGPRTKRRADLHSKDFLFAPKDVGLLSTRGKTDTFGLGYEAFKNAPEFSKPSIERRIQQGFGVGIFEEEDDEMVYDDSGPIYEATIKDEEYEETAKSKKSSRKVSSRFCTDAKPPLAGFVLSSFVFKESKWFPAPSVPKDFVPNPKLNLSKQLQQSKPSANHLNPDTRRDILGESALQGPTRSVFDYMPIKSQKRLESILAKAKPEIPTVDKEVAKSALQGFMPFGNDSMKQGNYKLYLTVMAQESNESLAHISESDLMEFAKSARIYRPMSFMMASRFTSSSALTSTPTSTMEDKDNTKETREYPKSQFNTATDAALRNDYGRLTRSTLEWRPARLVCKRFNVPNPYPDQVQTQEQVQDKDLVNSGTMDELIKERDRQLMNQESLEGLTGIESDMLTRDDEMHASKDLDVTDMQEEDDIKKPEMDIFKAIFAQDSSDEEEEEEPIHKTSLSTPLTVLPLTTPLAADNFPQDPIKKLDIKEQEPFRPMFRKRQDRKRQTIVPESQVSLVNPISLSQVQPVQETIKVQSKDEEEWVEASTLQNKNRIKASDLI